MTNPEFRRHRLRLIFPVIVALALLAGYTLLWFQGAKLMRSEIDAWVASERAMGREVSHGTIAVRGYPGSLRAEVEAPLWSVPGEWRWSGERLLIIAQPFEPRRLVLTPRGEQRAIYREAAYDLRADDMRIGLQDGLVAVDAAGITAEGGRRRYALGALRVNWIENDDGSAVLGLSAGQAEMTSEDGVAFVIPQLNAALSEGPESDLGLDAFEGAVGRNWEEKPALLSGEGRIAIDRNGYPSGRMDVSLRNAAELTETLVELGIVEPDQANMAAMLVGGLSGENGEASLPLQFTNGKLKLGPLPVADLPQLVRD